MSAASEPDARGSRRVELPIESIEHAARMLLGLGPELRVDAPSGLRRRVAQLAREIARRNAR